MDYKSEHPERYAELLKVLFGGTRPIVTHVKIEMGNDRNNSTGPDPATMRLASEAANVRRSPGFQLAADAKKVNPDLKVSILRWNAPGWANNNDKVYSWYKNTILAAYRTYGYMVDYVNPGLNERSPDLTWTKQYAARVKADAAGFNDATERALYNGIEVVDLRRSGIGSFGGSMVSDGALADGRVSQRDTITTPTTTAQAISMKLAEQLRQRDLEQRGAGYIRQHGLPSQQQHEGSRGGRHRHRRHQRPAGDGQHHRQGIRQLPPNYSSTSRPIGSFYEGGQYSFKELISARDPWSGWIHYDAGLDILRHFSWFAKAGWESRDNTAGIWRVVPQSSDTGATGTNPVNGRNGTPSYMTLAAPDKRNFSTVFVNDSERARTYKLRQSSWVARATLLELWETRSRPRGSLQQQLREIPL